MCTCVDNRTCSCCPRRAWCVLHDPKNIRKNIIHFKTQLFMTSCIPLSSEMHPVVFGCPEKRFLVTIKKCRRDYSPFEWYILLVYANTFSGSKFYFNQPKKSLPGKLDLLIFFCKFLMTLFFFCFLTEQMERQSLADRGISGTWIHRNMWEKKI